MSHNAYDLDSSDSSDSILQIPQKTPKKTSQGYSNDQIRKNNAKTYEYSDDYENAQSQISTRKSNRPKKAILNEKSKRKNYDINDSEEENYDDDNTRSKPINHYKYSKTEKKSNIKKKYVSDYDENDDSYHSQKNEIHNDHPNQPKSRAYSYGKSHKNDKIFLSFDLSDNDEDHDLDYPIKNKKQKSPDINSRSSAKYSNTIGGGENSLNYRSEEFNAQAKSKTKNIVRTNDFSSKRTPKTAFSKVQYQNYDSEDNSSDENDYSDDKYKIGHNHKKGTSKKNYDRNDSDNDSRTTCDRKNVDKEGNKNNFANSLNENCDWSFPMSYVPEPDDMIQIIEDYHDKYSIDYLLKRIMNNPSYKSSNDE